MHSSQQHAGFEKPLFAGGLFVFSAAAVLGWIKLRHGFSFHDEGMYMVDAWRMTAGDRLFPDNATSVLRLYACLNAAIFWLMPDITILGFRQVAYVAGLGSLLAVGVACWRWTGRYWYLPWVLALFAFTGLDPKGMVVSLSYHTWPHLLVALYVAAFLFGLNCTDAVRRRLWWVAAGCCMWGVGFSLLPLSVGLASPVLYWAAARVLAVDGPTFTVRDMAWVLAPAAMLWGVFLAVYNVQLVDALTAMVGYQLESKKPYGRLDTVGLQYIACVMVFFGAYLALLRLPVRARAGAAIGLALAFYGVMETRLFGLVTPFWRGWFNGPMWFAALLIAFTLFFIAHAVWKRRAGEGLGRDEQMVLAALVPVAVLAFMLINTSDGRSMSIVYMSIPAAVALAVWFLGRTGIREAGCPVQALLLVGLLLPFYAQAAVADWKFTYFDLPPSGLDAEIESGAAAGIRTNPVYRDMIRWITERAAAHAAPGDLAIFMEEVPMGYVLTGLRPALNHSWTGLARSPSLRRDAVDQMVRDGRHPRVAFRFVRAPYLFPDPTGGAPTAGGVIHYAPDDPIAAYIRSHMHLADRLDIGGSRWIEFYVAGPATSSP